MNKFGNQLLRIILLIPTTKVRILVSIGLSILVVCQAVFTNYQPSIELLSFLLLQQGLDISQYIAKQKAYASETVSAPESEAAVEAQQMKNQSIKITPPTESDKG